MWVFEGFSFFRGFGWLFDEREWGDGGVWDGWDGFDVRIWKGGWLDWIVKEGFAVIL